MNVVILGHVCIDQNVTEHAEYVSAGSPAMFMTKIFRKFPEVKSRIVSTYGPDFLTYLDSVEIHPKHPNCNTTLIYKNLVSKRGRIQKAMNRGCAVPVPINNRLGLHL